MKKVLIIILVVSVALSLWGCSSVPAVSDDTEIGVEVSEPTPEPTSEPTPEPTLEPTPEPTIEPTLEPVPPIEAVHEYIAGNGVKPTTPMYSDMDASGIIKDINGVADAMIAINKDSTKFVIFDMTIDKDGHDMQVAYIVNPENDLYNWMVNEYTSNGINGVGKVNPQTYDVTVDSVSNTDEQSIVAIVQSDLRALLPKVNEILSESGLHLSYEDFGFSKDIETLEIEVPKVEVPIEVDILKVEHNSAGTPEAYIVFTNTSDKKLLVFDFNILCIDAYGQLVEKYGMPYMQPCTYDDELNSGKSTSKNDYWSLYGLDTTKTIMVAISKYRLEGEGIVEVPNDQLEWIEME